MPEYTKCPWKAIDNGHFWEVKALRSGETEHHVNSPGVAFVWNVGAGTVDGNAHIMAAAPELLEACKAVVDICEDGDTGADFGRVVAAMHLAAAAIAKAEASHA